MDLYCMQGARAVQWFSTHGSSLMAFRACMQVDFVWHSRCHGYARPSSDCTAHTPRCSERAKVFDMLEHPRLCPYHLTACPQPTAWPPPHVCTAMAHGAGGDGHRAGGF